MEYDVLIVGAGPAGLSAAIKLKQLNADISVCILEKGAEVGAHILSGAILEPTALQELLPDWQSRSLPIHQPVKQDQFYYLTEQRQFKLPTPPTMTNDGNYIISLSELCKHLATIAEDLGVEIYPGFAGRNVVYDNQGHVIGIETSEMGVDKSGQHGANYQPGMKLLAKQTLFAEGSRGSLTKQVIKRFQLDKNACPQTYGLGFKEIWQVKQNNPGQVIHTVGWPMDSKTYGGSFIYHFDEDKVSIGFVVGLDYQNPWLSPFEEFQRFKTQPMIKALLEGGERLSYGAKSLVEGGLQSLPKLSFNGGMLIGDSAGFLNVAKIKGSHTAMKSGMLAAESIAENLAQLNQPIELVSYPEKIKNSWLYKELYQVRNIRPSFKYGLWPAMLYSAVDQYILRGKAPWTFKHQSDHSQLKSKHCFKPIDYPKPDGKLTFDKPSSVYLAGTFHEENQPCHLQLSNEKVAIEVNYQKYGSPETRYCPAGVYEIIYDEQQQPSLQINSQNCIHCKTCDIKDPYQNITWVPPEGGGGPSYTNM